VTREIGWAGMPVVPTFDKFTPRAIESGTSRAMLVAGKNSGDQFGSAAGKSASSRFGSVFKAGARAALLGLGAAAGISIKVGIDAVGLASDLAESENKVQQVFGGSAERIFNFSGRAAEKLGQTNQQARDAAATFGIFAGAADLSDKKAAGFAIKMTKLASDLASFNNTSPDQAIEALGAALRGESEPIRSYGVLLDEATLKAEALAIGLLKPTKNKAQIKAYQVAVIDGQKKYNDAVAEHGSKSLEALKAEASLGTARDRLKKATEGTIDPLTQQQKVLAAQSAIMKQTTTQQGDFERTSDGLANRQRILTARWTDAKAELGQGLLPVMEDATGFILDKGVPAVEKFADWFSKKATPAIGDFIEDAKPLANDILPTVRDLIDDLVGGFGDLAPLAKDVFDGFNDLPDGVKKGLLAGGGLFAASKLIGGGKNGSTGGRGFTPTGLAGATKDALVTKSGEFLADKLLQKFQKPLPVIVMNPGFGAPGKRRDGTPSVVATDSPDRTPGTSPNKRGPSTTTKAVGAATLFGVLADPEATKEAAKDFAKVWGNEFKAELMFPIDEIKREQAEPLVFERQDQALAFVDAAQDKAEGFGRELDLIGSKKVEPQFAVPGLAKGREGLAEFIRLQIEAGKPVAAYIHTTGIERAIEQWKTLNAEIARNTEIQRGIDNGAGYVRGGGTTTAPPAGVHIDKVEVNGSSMPEITRNLEKTVRRNGRGSFKRLP
jgi:hypothetical protein